MSKKYNWVFQFSINQFVSFKLFAVLSFMEQPCNPVAITLFLLHFKGLQSGSFILLHASLWDIDSKGPIVTFLKGSVNSIKVSETSIQQYIASSFLAPSSTSSFSDS